VDWIFGVHAVLSVLKSAPQRVEELVLQSGRQDDRLQKIQRLAELHGVTVQLASLKNISAKVTGRHQGVIARCAEGPTHDENFLYALAKKVGAKRLFFDVGWGNRST
jgi:23S rRNA (guanosine2251-2'-O)-methyltransferase